MNVATKIDAEFVDAMRAALSASAATRGLSAAEREDVIQEALARVIKVGKHDQLNAGELVAYATAVARNLVVDGIRQRRTTLTANGPLIEPAAVLSPEANARQNEVMEAVSALPAREREVVLLVLLDGLTTREVAQLIRIKQESVRRYLARAVLRLRTALDT